jgi:hypothetical protein
MDNVGTELGKAAREISEFSLNGHLDAALRGSSAQYDAADNINRLRVKLETQQPNDEGELLAMQKKYFKFMGVYLWHRRSMKCCLALTRHSYRSLGVLAKPEMSLLSTPTGALARTLPSWLWQTTKW